MKRLLLLIALIPSMAAAQVQYISFNAGGEEYDLGKNDIRVYMSASEIKKDFTAVGLIVCKKNNDKKAFKKAKKQAAKNGANAIYLYDEKDKTGGQKVLNNLLLTNFKDETKFIAVRTE